MIANGRQVNRRFLQSVPMTVNHSRYTFPHEVPTSDDWDQWKAFWENFTREGLCLELPLEKWLAPMHIRWKWFYYSDADIQHGDGGVDQSTQILPPISSCNTHPWRLKVWIDLQQHSRCGLRATSDSYNGDSTVHSVSWCWPNVRAVTNVTWWLFDISPLMGWWMDVGQCGRWKPGSDMDGGSPAERHCSARDWWFVRQEKGPKG